MIRFLVKTIILLALAAGAIVTAVAWTLPDRDQIARLVGRPTMEVAVGAGGDLAFGTPLLAVPVRRDQLPDHLVDALLTMEDRRFYFHPGIDPVGIGRALYVQVQALLGQEPGPAQGGSTLTQQLARNLFLSRERSALRKLREIVLALKLEWMFSKDEILELYFSSAYFGRDVHGVRLAARRYFRRRVGELRLFESAILVGLLPAPARYNPVHDWPLAKARARLVVEAMHGRGLITTDQLRGAVDRMHGIGDVRGLQTGGRDFRRIEHRWFRDWMRVELDRIGLGAGETKRVVMSLDPLLQLYAQIAVERILNHGRTQNVGQAALVAMTPEGAVRALVGGRSYPESQFDRATRARRQAGSAFKPVVYLAALEAGLGPETPLTDAPLTADGWPRNHQGRYFGTVPMEEALRLSLNAATVRLSEGIGRGRVVDLARRLGIESPLPDKPSLALGTGTVTLIELTAAYASFANGGFGVHPYAVEAIRTDAADITYWHSDGRGDPVASPRHVAALNRMLRGVLRSGGTGAEASFTVNAVGKTGTSQRNRDAWFIGFTGDLVCGIWVGNDDGSPMRGVTGGALPARWWKNFMANALDGRAPKPPPGLDGQ